MALRARNISGSAGTKLGSASVIVYRSASLAAAFSWSES